MTPDTPNHYGTISRALHWGMAVAIALMYLLAVAWRISGHTETLIPVHKALGTLLLMLVFAQSDLVWTLNCRRTAPARHQPCRPPGASRALPPHAHRADHRPHPRRRRWS